MNNELGIYTIDTGFCRDIFDAAYLWAQARIAALEADGNPAVAAILASSPAARP